MGEPENEPVRETLSPYIVVRNGAAAIAFYEKAFGATVLGRLDDPRTGAVMHAQLAIGEGKLMLTEEAPQWGSKSPLTLGGTPVTLHLYVPDVDATVARAVEAGATLTHPVRVEFWGDRYGRVTDPFGHSWSLATPVESVSLEELQERVAKMGGGSGA